MRTIKLGQSPLQVPVVAVGCMRIDRLDKQEAERFIQTLLREWAYAYCYPNSDARAAELEPWTHHYNWRRPHCATERLPPASRLGAKGNNVLGNYS